MPRKYGFSFSGMRALGISSAKQRLSRAAGIPLTKSGRERKIGRAVTSGCAIVPAVGVFVITGPLLAMLRSL